MVAGAGSWFGVAPGPRPPSQVAAVGGGTLGKPNAFLGKEEALIYGILRLAQCVTISI